MAGYIWSTECEKPTTKITLPGKDLIQYWWRNKKLFRQAKVKRIQYHQTSFTTNVKGPYIVRKYKRRKKDLQNQPQTIDKIAIETYISIITLNVNGLNAPTKRHRLAEWIQKKTHIYAIYKKPPSDLKTHIDWKWEDRQVEDRKIHSMQMGSKRKLE